MNKKTDSLNPREVWSFFSGAMGLDLGLERAGLRPTLANEINPTFCKTIRKNRPELDLVEGDIAALTGDSLRKRRQFEGEVFLVAGGPPCQPFSSGGRRAALSDPRGNLIYEYLRMISEVQPRYFILENVANLTTAALRHRPICERPGKHWSLKRYENPFANSGDAAALQSDELAGSALRQILTDACQIGYHINFAVVDAADYGAPQHRLRFVMLGSRERPAPELPAATHGPRGRAPYVTVRDAIGELLAEPGAHSEYTPSVRRYFALVPEGGNWRSLPKELQPEALGGSYAAGGGKTGFYRRLSWSTPSPTITGRANRKGSALCHPSELRPLSVRECAALQGFPRTWEFIGAMNSGYMQVGNAVPTALGEALGRAILDHHGRSSSYDCANVDMETMLTAAITRLRSAGRNKRSLAAA